jgi:hypothetical protein
MMISSIAQRRLMGVSAGCSLSGIASPASPDLAVDVVALIVEAPRNLPEACRAIRVVAQEEIADAFAKRPCLLYERGADF